jgi:hypothetical protein
MVYTLLALRDDGGPDDQPKNRSPMIATAIMLTTVLTQPAPEICPGIRPRRVRADAQKYIRSQPHQESSWPATSTCKPMGVSRDG